MFLTFHYTFEGSPAKTGSIQDTEIFLKAGYQFVQVSVSNMILAYTANPIAL